MQFVRPDINIDFIGKRKMAFVLSALLILGALFTLFIHKGPRYGIDFAGGTLIQIRFSSPTDIGRIQTGLKEAGLTVSTVQTFGEKEENEFLIRTDQSIETGGDFSAALSDRLKAATGIDAEIRRVEMVGPQVGKDLQEKALLAIFYSLLFITIYISGRFEFKWALSAVIAGALMGGVYVLSLFNVSMVFLIGAALVIALALFWFFQLKYAMGAIVALIHDVFITIGFFSLFEKEFTLPIIAALLTIVGYSLNDTIIVYDRIRENLKKYHKQALPIVVNRSINETLSRTLLTSGTTLIVVLALLILGGGIIHDFAFALLVGIVIGTYSSIFVASPFLMIGPGRRG